MQTRDPPKALKASVGIDSVFLQIKDINLYDVQNFCEKRGLRYQVVERTKYTTKWSIFLAGGQPITVVYHARSKTVTFQIGKLMNYSINLDEQHRFLQDLLAAFAHYEVSVSDMHIAADVKVYPIPLTLKEQSGVDMRRVGSTTYCNYTDGIVVCMYDKAAQMMIYSTPLTRIELRLPGKKLRSWKAKDFFNSRQSLKKLAGKVQSIFRDRIGLYTALGGNQVEIDLGDVEAVLEDFIAFAQGDEYRIKDHFKVRQAVTARDNFLDWMRKHDLKDLTEIKGYVKGRKAQCLDEIGIDHKTFNKALETYKGIPNFKISV